MKQINELIKNMSIYDLKSCKVSYDEILNDTEMKKEVGKNYWLLKYYNGTISKEEHEKCKNGDFEFNKALFAIYDFVFDDSKIDFEYNPDDQCNIIDCISELWIMRPRKEFQYENEFKKIMFDLYSKTHDEKLREVALEYHLEHKEEGANCKENDEFFLINNKSEKNYNINYGIEKIFDESKEISQDKNETLNDRKQQRELEQKDWILEKFGE